jgi:hypothetical protein
MPIGTSATYSATGVVEPPTASTLTVDGATLIQDPTAPLTAIKQNGGQHSNTCAVTGGTLATDPILGSLVLAASSHNSGVILLHADGQTIDEGGAFARCVANTPATAGHLKTYGTIYGAGLTGGAGGSGLSYLGGLLRPGEIAPGKSGPPHVLSINIDCAHDCTPTLPGFRWPATKKDSYAYSPGGTTPALSMGALLAIPPTVSCASLGLDAAGMELCWTLQNYGAYVKNDSARSVVTIGAEQGDANTAAQFQADWGFPLATAGVGGAGWGASVQKIISDLAVVTNNGPTSIGGGGTPLQPLAPGFGTGCVSPSPTAAPTVDADGDIDQVATPGPTPCPSPSATATATGTPTSSPTATATPTATASPTPSPSPTSTPPPGAQHVLVIMEENKGYAATLGTCSADPYLCSLAAKYASFTNSHGVSHPSEPNYVAFDSGGINGCTTDSSCAANSLSVPDLGGQLTAKGIPRVGWMESMPSACYTGGSSGGYALKHNPFEFFKDNQATCRDLPYPGSSSALSTLDGAAAPDFAWITPNLTDDMHDGTVQQGDAWLSSNLAPILASPWFLNFPSTVIVTMDEGDAGSTNQVPTVVISSVAQGKGAISTFVNHYGVLRSIEETYGLGLLGAAASASNGDLSALFG